MLIELYASLVITTTNIKEVQNVLLVSSTSVNNIVAGESLIQREQREREAQETARRNEQKIRESRRAVVPRDRNTTPTGQVIAQSASSGNGYVKGYCTWYVKEQKPEIPNDYGNAKNWPVNSQIPTVGAIIVTYESWLGHVGIVTQVDGYEIVIAEMNYEGWNKVSIRRVNYKNLPLKGFLIAG